MKRTTASLLTGALAAGTFATLATIAPSIASAGSCTTTVTNENLQGWALSGERGGVAKYNEVGTDPQGVLLSVPVTQTDAYALLSYNGTTGVPLAGQTSQGDYAIIGDTAGRAGLFYSLEVDLDGNGSTDTELRNEPNEPSYASDSWWSTAPLDKIEDDGGHGSPDYGDLDEFSLAYPNAVINGFYVGLANWGGQPDKVARVDSVKFGCNVFSFELANRAPSAVIVRSDANDNDYRTFTFDGSASSDPENSALLYTWSVDGGTGSDSTLPVYNVTFPNGPGTYTVTLTVTDGDKNSTVTDTVEVTPPSNTQQSVKLADTGASVIALAALAGIGAVGGTAGTVLSRRRRNSEV